MHVDGDSFFAACEVARRPDLRGKPVVVGEERGIASAMTYEAKKLGIHRGMPIYQIRERFPDVTVLSSHFELYQEYHDNMMRIIETYVSNVQSYSIDECFAELPALPPHAIDGFVRKIKSEVQLSLGSTFSFGVAPTKTLAKLASKLKKPDGCVVLIGEDTITEALKETPVGSIWGIGYKTNERLSRRGIRTAHEFTQMQFADIEKYFAEPVADIWRELSGTKIHEVHADREDQQSISATRSLVRATEDPKILFSELSRNIEIACAQLRAADLYTNAIHCYYAHKIGQSRYKYRRSAGVKLPIYTHDTQTILAAAAKLIPEIYKTGLRYKSTGVTISGLKRKESVQNDLFGAQQADYGNMEQWTAIDGLNRRFGDFKVMYASSMRSVKERREDGAIRAANDTYEYGLPLPYMGEVW
jgi:DNA polymerase-4/DNA polymerase V